MRRLFFECILFTELYIFPSFWGYFNVIRKFLMLTIWNVMY